MIIGDQNRIRVIDNSYQAIKFLIIHNGYLQSEQLNINIL